MFLDAFAIFAPYQVQQKGWFLLKSGV